MHGEMGCDTDFAMYYSLCDVNGVVYEKFIQWVISTAYESKHVINMVYRIWIHIKDLAAD